MIRTRIIRLLIVIVIGVAVGSAVNLYRTRANPPIVRYTAPQPSASTSGDLKPDIACATSDSASSNRVDVLFVLDVTGSMGGAIEGVKNGIRNFVKEFKMRDMDPRVGLIAYRDRSIGEEPQLLRFPEQIFTSDPDCFRSAVSKLMAYDGGDAPESTLDALVLASKQTFRADANRKVLILITDAPPRIPDVDTPTIADAITALRKSGVTFFYIIANDKNVYTQMQKMSGVSGAVLPLTDAARGNVDFDRLLPEIAKKAAQ